MDDRWLYISLLRDGIKPCPFCGFEFEEGAHRLFRYMPSYSSGVWTIEINCGECGCIYELGKFIPEGKDLNWLIDEAIERWNRRA